MIIRNILHAGRIRVGSRRNVQRAMWLCKSGYMSLTNRVRTAITCGPGHEAAEVLRSSFMVPCAGSCWATPQALVYTLQGGQITRLL